MFRIPLAATVVGALLVGGATTGATRASWTDQATTAGSSVASGAMAFTSTSPAGTTTLTKGASTGTTFEVTLTDTSMDGSKNLRQDIRLGSVSKTGTLNLSDLKLLVAKKSGSCSTAVPSADADGYTTPALDRTAPAVPDQSYVVCVTVAAKSTAATSSGTLVLSFAGAQVRPDGSTITGWTSSGSSTIALDIPAVDPPAAPTLSCGTRQNNNEFSMTWPSVSGATSYTVFRSMTTNADGSYLSQGNQTSPYVASISADGTTFWRVKANNASGTSAFSNTIRITRTGNGVNQFVCVGVTP